MLPALTLAILQDAPLNLPQLAKEAERPIPPARAEVWRGWLGKDLPKGVGARVEYPPSGPGYVAFAISATDAKTVEVSRTEDPAPLKLRKIAPDLWALVVPAKDGEARRFEYRVDGKKVGDTRQYEAYAKAPEDVERPGVLRGETVQMPDHASAIYPGTTRPWWVYKPAKPAPEGGYNLVVFQDGQWARYNYPLMLDNMIAEGQIPPTVAVFVKPGSHEGKDGDNRAREYDVISSEYSDMILTEILPKVDLPLTKDPARRAICGESSGAICAFTAAWEHPESFGLVMSAIGTYVNIGSLFPDSPGKGIGGQNYPYMIRRMPKRPIRIAFQDGDQDLDNEWGNWPLANLTMKKALDYKGYDNLFVYGHGFHSGAHLRALFPRFLRWLVTSRE